MSKKKTYESALAELRNILSKLQSDDLSIDELGSNITKAEGLLEECKNKLRGIEKEIESIKD